jgi:hypothetical protein
MVMNVLEENFGSVTCTLSYIGTSFFSSLLKDAHTLLFLKDVAAMILR